MKILELFSGTESFSKVARVRGHTTFTIDNNQQHNPNLCQDIFNLELKDIPFKPDVIWASPPCTCFSVASIPTHWKGGKKAYIPKTRQAENSIDLIKQTLFLIEKLKPRFWFIENPRGVLRKLEPLKDSKPFTVTYCQYGDERMKPTDIWTNCKDWKPKKMCKNGDSCHIPAPRGSKTGTQGRKNSINRSKIPRELCLEIIKVCEEKMKQKQEENCCEGVNECINSQVFPDETCENCGFPEWNHPVENAKIDDDIPKVACKKFVGKRQSSARRIGEADVIRKSGVRYPSLPPKNHSPSALRDEKPSKTAYEQAKAEGTFNLSEERKKLFEKAKKQVPKWVIKWIENQDKEFISRLKEKPIHKKKSFEFCDECLPTANKMLEESDKRIIEKIDKLAGDDLKCQ